MAFDLFKPKAPPLFGLDISSSSVKVLEIAEAGKDAYRVERYAIEPRHASWLESKPLELLARHHVALAIADSGGRFPSGEHLGGEGGEGLRDITLKYKVLDRVVPIGRIGA